MKTSNAALALALVNSLSRSMNAAHSAGDLHAFRALRARHADAFAAFERVLAADRLSATADAFYRS